MNDVIYPSRQKGNSWLQFQRLKLYVVAAVINKQSILFGTTQKQRYIGWLKQEYPNVGIEEVPEGISINKNKDGKL